MATEIGAPDDCTTTPPSPVGGAQEKVEEKDEQVEVAEHGKIGYAPKVEIKEVNMCKAEDIAKLPDQLEDAQIDVEGEPKEDQKLDELPPEVANPKAEEKQNMEEDKQPELDLHESVPKAATSEKLVDPDTDESVPKAATSEKLVAPHHLDQKEAVEVEAEAPQEETVEGQGKREQGPKEVESKGQSYVSEAIKPTETLEALMRKEKENQDESIEDMLGKDHVPNGSTQHTEEVVEHFPEKKIQETEVKHINHIITKVKHTLVKAKKAIIGKSTSLKAMISTDARG